MFLYGNATGNRTPLYGMKTRCPNRQTIASKLGGLWGIRTPVSGQTIHSNNPYTNRPKTWQDVTGSNRRHFGCKPNALPTELTSYIMVETNGIEPFVSFLGGFTVPCHTLQPNLHIKTYSVSQKCSVGVPLCIMATVFLPKQLDRESNPT